MHNYDDTYYGSSSLETATIHSDNSVYAELALGDDTEVHSGCGGSQRSAAAPSGSPSTAHEMGLDTKFSTNPSMVLGAIDPGVSPLEMAHAYQTISAGGERVGGNLDASPVRTTGPISSPRSPSTRSAPRAATRSPRTSRARSASSPRAPPRR